jgi:hypothetical protein
MIGSETGLLEMEVGIHLLGDTRKLERTKICS